VKHTNKSNSCTFARFRSTCTGSTYWCGLMKGDILMRSLNHRFRQACQLTSIDEFTRSIAFQLSPVWVHFHMKVCIFGTLNACSRLFKVTDRKEGKSLTHLIYEGGIVFSAKPAT